MIEKRTAIYTRVSTDEQVDGFSLSAQLEAVKRFCELRGWSIVTVYEERGRSGKSALRPEFQRMIRDAEAGRFDVIVVHKLDRFSRSLLDVLTYLKRLDGAGVSFVSASEDFDFSTPFGKVVLAMLASFAEWYLDNLRTEISKGKKERARQGGWNGTLAWGYTTQRELSKLLTTLGEQFKAGEVDETEYSRRAGLIEDTLEQYSHLGETDALPCPFNASGVALAFERYSTGMHSDSEIARMLNDAGYRIYASRRGTGLFGRDTVEDILKNRFYTGQTSYGQKKSRQWLPGKHQPLVSHELWQAAQDARARRRAAHTPSVPSRAGAVYPLSGVLVCAHCGLPMIGLFRRGVRSYRDCASSRDKTCGAAVKSAAADALESIIGDFMTGLKLPDDWQRAALATLGASHAVPRPSNPKTAKQLERLKNLYVLGDISEAEYIRRRDELNAVAVASSSDVSKDDLEAAAALLSNLPALHAAATPEERRELYRALFKRVYFCDGVIKAVEPTPVMWALLAVVLQAGGTGNHPAPSITIVRPGTPLKEIQKIAA